jgi:hypothetical protein
MVSYKITQSGQGLIEIIVAIAIIVTGISGAVTLTYSNLRSNESSITQIIGANLAREGVEVVRNLRDENWLLGSDNWYDGIRPMPMDFNSGILKFTTSTNIWSIEFRTTMSPLDSNLYLDANGVYSHDNNGVQTQYRRIVEIYDIFCQKEKEIDIFPVIPNDCPFDNHAEG